MGMNPRLLRPRATGFNPKSISGLAAWYDAADSTTLTLATGVSQWSDKSGNGRNLTQSTGNNQPASGTRTIGGKNALDFDGTNDVLVLGSYGINLASTKAMTMLVVASSDSPNTVRRLVSLQRDGKNANDTGGYFGRHNQVTSAVEVSIGGGDSTTNDQLDRNLIRYVSQNVTTASVYAMSVSAADNALTLHIDGTGQTLTTRYGTMAASNWLAFGSGNHTLDVGAIRSSGNSVASYWDGLVGEILLYTQRLSDARRRAAERYLGNKWGITVA